MTENAAEPNALNHHPVHYYMTGDVLLELQGVLFRVHKAKLCQASEVFEDMFGLLKVGSSDGTSVTDVAAQITLHDEPTVFAMLLDVIYQNATVPFMVKEQLLLALLAHKYEIPTIIATCQSRIWNRLPTGISSRDFHQTDEYQSDPSISQLVIRAAELLHMPDIWPWAMYYFTIRPESSPPEPSIIIRRSREGELASIRKINEQAIKHWNSSVARFMRAYCAAEWWDEPDECWRRTELLDLERSSFVLRKDVIDPLQEMYRALDYCSEDLCSLCADEFNRHVGNRIMQGMLDKISLHLEA